MNKKLRRPQGAVAEVKQFETVEQKLKQFDTIKKIKNFKLKIKILNSRGETIGSKGYEIDASICFI